MTDVETTFKNRLTGAIVWLGLLVIIVPHWYSHPVNFQPDQMTPLSSEDVQKVTEKPFILPASQSAVEHDKSLPVSKPSQPQVSAKTANVESRQAKNEVKEEITKSEAAAKGSWLIRLVTFDHQEDAEALETRLRYDYEAYTKFYPKSKKYSVRIGPYTNKQQAVKDQQRLDEVLRIQSELVRIN